MDMVVESMEVASGVDGDCSEGTSPSRQGAGTDTSVPRNLSAMAAARVFLSNMAYPSRFYASGAIYRRKGGVRGLPWALSCIENIK